MNRYKFLALFLFIFHKNYNSPVPVNQGGSNTTNFIPYAVICSGTTTTGTLQSVASAGTSGQGLIGNGSSTFPTFKTIQALKFIRTLTASASSTLTFTSSDITSTYSSYFIIINAIVPSTSASMNMDWSTNNGSSYLNTNFLCGLNYHASSSAVYSNTNSTTTCPISNAGSTQICAILCIQGLAGTAATGPSYYGQSMYFNAVPTLQATELFGLNTGSANVNNIKFSLSAGTMTSGTISLYGCTTS